MYEKQTWVDGVSIANAERLNHIENGIENINKMSSNAYFIGRYTKDTKFEPTGDHLILLSPDSISINNMKFENNTLTINEDGLYYVNIYIRLDRGCRHSFIDIDIKNGGTLSPMIVRSQNTENMYYNENELTAGDPAYELNRPVYLKKGALLKFGFWNDVEVSITGGNDFDANSSCISVIKIGNYPEVA